MKARNKIELLAMKTLKEIPDMGEVLVEEWIKAEVMDLVKAGTGHKEEFLNRDKVIAVVGASANTNKWGWKIYKELKSADFKVYPVNPKYGMIEKDVCYPKLQMLPKKSDVVITVVPPRVTEQIVKQCKSLKIGKIWMQPGSESEKVINFCKNNNIKAVYNVCFVVDGLKKKFGD